MGGEPPLKLAWERDLNILLTESESDGEWNAILYNMKKMSRELRTRLIQFKILNRIYWTPVKLHRAK